VQAGAPLNVFVVLIDAKTGNPVSGKSIRATFSGPGQQAPVDGKEDTASLGPGRYEFAIAALDPGKWQVTIAVGTEGQGTYSLDVTR
jgi:YtkA-like protein